jgi:acyl-coenzyme A synthetase/AMP-(fatty) acid ligase
VSATVELGLVSARAPGASLPLLADANPARVLAWRENGPVCAGAFLAEVRALAKLLPAAAYAINLCEDRYSFLLAFCAVATARQTNLLPASRVPDAISEVMQAYPRSYVITDQSVSLAAGQVFQLPALLDTSENSASQQLMIEAEQVVAIGFTSGSTGAPKANTKTWASLCASSALNALLLCPDGTAPNIVATVPPQHMYGLELSVLLPLRSGAAIHAGHPFFPADIAHALAHVPAPRLLVTTPFHLRALMQSDTALPPLAGIVTATAALEEDLAAEAERRHGAPVIEVFGSTETCVIAQRRTARCSAWQLYPGIDLHPQPDGTLVSAPHICVPTLLQDIVELLPSNQFILRGRNSDLLEIAGKRASLADLTRRLLAVPGVTDGVVFQLDAEASGVCRLAALAVAPGLQSAAILTRLRESIDPAFLPRPLRVVAALPRNGAGKLPRTALLEALRSDA